MKSLLSNMAGHAKRVIIGVIGFTVLTLGVAMIVLPGPAVIVIPVGLGILATEFLWARKLLDKAKHKLKKKADACG
jgi:tellurite resistance protein TerC